MYFIYHKPGELQQKTENTLLDIPILGHLDNGCNWVKGTEGLKRVKAGYILNEVMISSAELIDTKPRTPFGKVICKIFDEANVAHDINHFYVKFRVEPFVDLCSDSVAPGRQVLNFMTVCSIVALPSEPHESLGFKKFEVNPEMTGFEFVGITTDPKEVEVKTRAMSATKFEPVPKKEDYVGHLNEETRANREDVSLLLSQLVEISHKLASHGVSVSTGNIFDKFRAQKRISVMINIEDLYQAGANIELFEDIPPDGPHTFPHCRETPWDLK